MSATVNGFVTMDPHCIVLLRLARADRWGFACENCYLYIKCTLGHNKVRLFSCGDGMGRVQRLRGGV